MKRATAAPEKPTVPICFQCLRPCIDPPLLMPCDDRFRRCRHCEARDAAGLPALKPRACPKCHGKRTVKVFGERPKLPALPKRIKGEAKRPRRPLLERPEHLETCRECGGKGKVPWYPTDGG